MATTNSVQQRKTTVMTDSVFKWWDYPIFAALTVAMLTSVAYFLVYWFSRRDWMYYPLPFCDYDRRISSLPVPHSTSQTCTVKSVLPEAIRVLSGDQASAVTMLVWP